MEKEIVINEQKEFLQKVDKAYPNMSQRQIGYILGVADTVAEKKAAKEEQREEQPA